MRFEQFVSSWMREVSDWSGLLMHGERRLEDGILLSCGVECFKYYMNE